MKGIAGVAFSVAWLSFGSLAWAQAREGHEGHTEPYAPQRAAAPRFTPHPPGAHPHGPIVRPHAVRALAPKVVVHGSHAWDHWDHPVIIRPMYFWDWTTVRQVSCVAEDSYGDQYPVTEVKTPGFGLESMTGVENDALDRCYSESGKDETCYLATCSPS